MAVNYRIEMKSQMKKNRNKGFTLGELLIVVAIIGVLVAISIPIFTSQLEKAREATDAANIRSQYAEVMAEAITDGGDVDGKVMFGAVDLKQKKDQWQSTGLKENLEGVYQSIEGDHPKAGGTAWVEYKDDQVILHYGDGSGNSGSGNAGGGSTGGSTGESVGGSTGGNTEGGSTDGGSESSGETSTIQKIQASSQAWPINSNVNFSFTRGQAYTYNGKIYISAVDQTLNPQGNPAPGGWYEGNFVSPNNTILTRANVDDQGNVKGGVKRGDIFIDDDGTTYIMKTNSDWHNAPNGNTENSNWIKLQLN